MLKNFPWKTVLLTLLAWMLFWEVKDTITGDRMFFLVRWFCYDMSHTKKIEVLPYLLTDEQVSNMFSHRDETVRQLTEKELSSKNINVVLRIKNLGDGIAWGKLSWDYHHWGWKKVDVSYMPGKADSGKYADIVIPIGNIAFREIDAPPEPLTIKWNELYVYH